MKLCKYFHGSHVQFLGCTEIISKDSLKPIKPLAPRSDENVSSLYNIHTIFSTHVIRILNTQV